MNTVTSAIGRARAVGSDPLATALRWRAQLNPTGLFERHARLAAGAGIDRVYLILSFDCDTQEDAEVVTAVHDRLGALGVVPTYAVPGELLRRAAPTYAALAARGAEFLNHGGVEHTYFDEALGRYRSCFFYDTLTPERVRQDVEEGHAFVTKTIGTRPTGFRTPHFGTFQQAGQLKHLHRILEGLGYRFSTSTTPRFGLRHGPVSTRHGLPELPVSGSPDTPVEILDTWAFFAAPDRTRSPGEYAEQAAALGEGLAKAGAGLINVYGDPIHIHDRPEFFDAVASWTEIAEPISFAGLLDRIGA